MDSLLQEITILPGVLGCFVFSSEQQIAGSKMPPIFKENSIRTIGNLLTRTIQIGNIAQMEFKGIELKYNESLLIIKPLAKDALLVIICEPSANKSLISMTTGMLADDLRKAMTASPGQARTKQSRPMAQQAGMPTPPQTQQEPEKEAEISAELAPVLEQVKDALAMAIGPIAAPVMKDTIEVWAKEGDPTLANLPSLAKLLCDEINDDDLEEEFLSEISQIKG
jgi:hypothetical protein